MLINVELLEVQLVEFVHLQFQYRYLQVLQFQKEEPMLLKL